MNRPNNDRKGDPREMKMSRPGSRRAFLRGAAGASLMLPQLSSLMGRKAAAQGVGGPRRLICVYIPQQETEGFLPKTAPFSLTGTYLEPLEPWKNRMLFVHNMKGTDGHMEGHSESLTGFANADWRPTAGPSLDQLVAKRIGGATKLPSLELTGASPWDSNRDDGVHSWTDKCLPVQSIPDARRAFERVFGAVGGAPVVNTSALQAAELAAKRKRLQKSLLDSLITDYKRTTGTMSPGDRQLLDAHLTLLREQEQRLQAEPAPSAGSAVCTTPGAPAADIPWQDYPKRMQHHVDTIVGAFRCDATRVATLSFGLAQEGVEHTWIGSNDNFHSIAHGDVPNAKEQHFAVRKWQAGLLANMLKGLESIPEGNGTALDNTTILRVSELGYYPWSQDATGRHLREQVSSLIIGNAGGYFKTGRMVDVQQSNYCNSLLTMAHAMGYTDVAKFGKSGTTPLAALRA